MLPIFDSNMYNRTEVLNPDKSLIDLYAEALIDLRHKNSFNSLNKNEKTIFNQQSQEVLHGYLYLKYNKLYLKWLFIDNGNEIEYYRCHKSLKYTGELNGFNFSNGILSTERNPEKEYRALKNMFTEKNEAAITKEYGLSVEEFAKLFSKQLKNSEYETKKYFYYLSNLFEDEIKRRNRRVHKNDIFLSTESSEYVYNDHIIICDEYSIIYYLLTDLANYKFFKKHTKFDPYSFCKDFIEDEMTQFMNDIKLSFDTPTLRSIIKSSLSDKPLSEELKDKFLLMMYIMEKNLKNKQTKYRN